MDVLELLRELVRGEDVEVVVAGLPEVVSGAFELARGLLLEGLEEGSERDVEGLVDEEVDVLGHQDIGVDPRVMAGSGAFEDLLDGGHCGRVSEVGEAAVAAKGDEVLVSGLLVAL